MVKILTCIIFGLKKIRPQGLKVKIRPLQCPRKTEPGAVVPVARVDVVAIQRTQMLRIVVPTTATNNTVKPGGIAQMVSPPLHSITPRVLHPLPDVSVHIVKPVGVCPFKPYGMGLPV